MENEKDRGLIVKYRVERVGDEAGKHADCRYFVLDPQHDPIAREALLHYAIRAEDEGYLALAQDIYRWLRGD